MVGWRQPCALDLALRLVCHAPWRRSGPPRDDTSHYKFYSDKACQARRGSIRRNMQAWSRPAPGPDPAAASATVPPRHLLPHRPTARRKAARAERQDLRRPKGNRRRGWDGDRSAMPFGVDAAHRTTRPVTMIFIATTLARHSEKRTNRSGSPRAGQVARAGPRPIRHATCCRSDQIRTAGLESA